MLALGNDVVDLTSPHARGKGRNYRFIQKILTDREQHVLKDSDRKDIVLWQFWSAKESAYKALSRYHPKISGTPRHYEVNWDQISTMSKLTGTVHTPMGKLHALCWTGKTTICCICMEPSWSMPVFGVGLDQLPPESPLDFNRTTQEQSRLVRIKARQSLAAFLGKPIRDIDIPPPHEKNGTFGPPEVRIKGRQSNIILSLSHDGRHVFFAWALAAPILW